MEVTSYSVSYFRSTSLSPLPFPVKSTLFPRGSVNFSGYNCLASKLNYSAINGLRKFGAITAASGSENRTAINGSIRWLLEPIGNGDTRHIGYKIPMPGTFEIDSNVVTVGRVGDKADIVISVPTVSAVHARIQKTEENLLITDLDSTNGTFIGEKRLQPGVVYPASPGNLVTFGDTNLAIFRVYKLREEELSTEPEESGAGSENESAS
ncbi:SMAD/FHA domain-containing protein [Striga asiatica]|uniref:SMAD/FHA domain-containing protein n=1 Tax=Striga asiatica TaxID=4170 RepID=A0A5A7Q7C7_STRAF|nr:SMAD/FHA domain-containing protein [Striga asiatica]GER41173.1 SMAD/FHA domain-containing protein [Striga asiatica]